MKRPPGLLVVFTIPFLALACSGDSDGRDDAVTGDHGRGERGRFEISLGCFRRS
jgi:hypothetical protein